MDLVKVTKAEFYATMEQYRKAQWTIEAMANGEWIGKRPAARKLLGVRGNIGAELTFWIARPSKIDRPFDVKVHEKYRPIETRMTAAELEKIRGVK